SGTISYDNPIFKYDASDTDGNIAGFYRTLGSKYKIDGNTPDESCFSLNKTYQASNLSDGSYTFYVRAKDNDGSLSPIVSKSVTVSTPVYSDHSATIHYQNFTSDRVIPGQILTLVLSYQNQSNVDWKSDSNQTHYVELQSVDQYGNSQESFLADSSWNSSSSVGSFNASNVAAPTHENAWFKFTARIPENAVPQTTKFAYFRPYNPQQGLFGEIIRLVFHIVEPEDSGSSVSAYYDWNFKYDSEGWRERNANSEGINANEYWVIDPVYDPVTFGGIVIDSELTSFHTDEYNVIEVRASIEHVFVENLEAHIQINGQFQPPIKLNYVSGAKVANSQCVYKGNIGYSGLVDGVRIDFVDGEDGNNDRVFIDYVRIYSSKPVTQNKPSGTLAITYDPHYNIFYLNYMLNEHSDSLKIIYSLDYGGNWKQIYELQSVGNNTSGNPAVNIDNSKDYTYIEFKLEVINNATNEKYISGIKKRNYTPLDDYVEKGAEYPVAPYLYGMGSYSDDDQVTIQWRKIIDSNNNDNVNYYEIEYADNDSFAGSSPINIGNPATGTNMYETIKYTISSLQDTKTYYFRVRGINNKGYGDWSNIRSLRIDIQDWPYFDTSYQEPANGAMNVSKTPILRWRAIDADGDDLDYKVVLV
ncbi:MAG: hypothetical protein OMM_10574, partial [Candidatus Magnetoglobus multicellularis str. Araruama]